MSIRSSFGLKLIENSTCALFFLKVYYCSKVHCTSCVGFTFCFSVVFCWSLIGWLPRLQRNTKVPFEMEGFVRACTYLRIQKSFNFCSHLWVEFSCSADVQRKLMKRRNMCIFLWVLTTSCLFDQNLIFCVLTFA